MEPYEETHQQGRLSIEMEVSDIALTNFSDCDFGVQIASDGRVWVCVNGVAFLRFKPHRNEKKVKI